MRIIYVTERLPYGQGEAFIYPEIEELINSGHELGIAPIHGSFFLNRDTDVTHAAGQSLLDRTLTIIPNVLSLGSALTGNSRHLIHGANLKRTLLNLRSVLLGKSLADAANTFQADFIHAHWANFTATTAMVASELSGIPWGFTAHRYDIVENNHLLEKLIDADLPRFVSKKSLGLAETILQRNLREEGAIVLPLGIKVPPAPNGPVKSDQVRVAVPANLIPIKGHRYLIHGVKLLTDRGVRLTVECLGDGPERKALNSLIRQLRLDGVVKILTPVSQDALHDRYRGGYYSMVVLPSLDLGGGQHEGIPLSLSEAMAYGVPVIGTMTGAIPELFDGGMGQLVHPADPIALAGAIEWVIKHPAESREAALRAYTSVTQRFNIRSTVETLTRFFEASRR